MKYFEKRNRPLFSNWAAKWGMLALPISLGILSCQQDMPTHPESQAKNPSEDASIAARTTPGSTDPNIIWIRTLSDLRNMNLWGNYKLANNIDASATARSPFVPIGDFPFTGTLDGNKFTISNLTISGGEYTGIFKRALLASFKNLRLTKVKVTGGYHTGTLAGYAEGIDLTDSYISGTVTGNAQANRIGLAFGSIESGSRILRCNLRGKLTGHAYHMGGVAGHAAFYGENPSDPADDMRIILDEVFVQDTTLPSITSGSAMVAAGGLVGTLIGGNIQNVNAVVSITGRYAAGGLFGHIINDDPNSIGSFIRGGLSRGVVTDNANPNRTGAIGMMSGMLIWGPGAYYDKDTDGGITNPLIPDPALCQVAFSSPTLKAPKGGLNRLLDPYYYGLLITQDLIDDDENYDFDQCDLGSGSDGDWGFGTCNATPIWALNSDKEYNTLLRIPNPSEQPK